MAKAPRKVLASPALQIVSVDDIVDRLDDIHEVLGVLLIMATRIFDKLDRPNDERVSISFDEARPKVDFIVSAMRRRAEDRLKASS